MDTRKLSRLTGAACLVLAPAGFLLGFLTEARYDQDAPGTTQLAEVAGQSLPSTGLRVAVPLLIMLMPVAVLYAAGLARRGAPRLAFAGGAISFLAWSAGIGSLGAVNSLYWYGSRLPETGVVAALIDAVTGDATFNTLVGIFVIGHLLGMLTLGIALWRSRAVPAWAGLLFAVSPILHGVAMGFGPVADAVAYGLLGVAMVVCALRLARMSDDEWDLPPAPARGPRTGDDRASAAPRRVAA